MAIGVALGLLGFRKKLQDKYPVKWMEVSGGATIAVTKHGQDGGAWLDAFQFSGRSHGHPDASGSTTISTLSGASRTE